MKLTSLKYLLNQAFRTFMRFPLTLMMGMLITTYAWHIISLSMKTSSSGVIVEIKNLIVLALGIPCFLFYSLYFEGKKPHWKKILLFPFGTLTLALFYYLLKDKIELRFLLLTTQISIVLHLLIGLVPVLVKKEEAFWQYNKHFFLSFLSSALYTAFLFIGISIALGALTYLFNMQIKSEVYLRLLAVCLFTFQGWYFLGGLPKKITDFADIDEYPNSLRVITQYLFIPLVTLYSFILYAYLGKIVLTWSLPKGFVGWMVSIMSSLGILNLLLLDPIKNKSESTWVRGYGKYFYLLLMPLLMMLFIGIYTRISEYGFTEKRYMLLAFALWLLGLSFYFILSKKKEIKWVPISLAALIFLSSFGPWGAYQVSMNSQLKRFKKLALEQKVKLLNFEENRTYDLHGKYIKEFSSISDYLASTHGREALEQIYSEKGIENSRYKGSKLRRREEKFNSSLLVKSLGLAYAEKWQQKSKSDDIERKKFFYLYGPDAAQSAVLELSRFNNVFMNVTEDSRSAHYIGSKRYRFVMEGVANDRHNFTVIVDGINVYSQNLIPLIQKVQKRVNRAPIILEFKDSKGRSYLVYFLNINAARQGDKFNVSSFKANVFVGK